MRGQMTRTLSTQAQAPPTAAHIAASAALIVTIPFTPLVCRHSKDLQKQQRFKFHS